jgi:hypothetical protein
MKDYHGMLWQIETNENLEEDIKKAIAYYEKKYEREGKVVAISEKTFASSEVPEKIAGRRVHIDKAVLPYHIFVGENWPPLSEAYEGAEI